MKKYKKYIGTITGEFTEVQKVEAENIEDARKQLSENAGETLERTASGSLEVSKITEVE